MQVIYEDNHIIAVNKEVGEIVQGDKTGDETIADKVKAYIKKKYNKPGDVFLGIVHRLDRPVSGVVLFARTSKALTRLNKLFQEKEINKTYWAIVENRPPEDADTLTGYLKKNEKQNKSYVSKVDKPDRKKAVLDYKLVGATKKYYLLEIKLHTGRHHQIRAQLSDMGCAIKGDLKYGAKRSNQDGGIHLHAVFIEFNHPVKQEKVKIKAPLPKDNLWREFYGLL